LYSLPVAEPTRSLRDAAAARCFPSLLLSISKSICPLAYGHTGARSPNRERRHVAGETVGKVDEAPAARLRLRPRGSRQRRRVAGPEGHVEAVERKRQPVPEGLDEGLLASPAGEKRPWLLRGLKRPEGRNLARGEEP